MYGFHGFNRVGSDSRKVETQVLLGLASFHDHDAFTAQRAGTPDRLVRALHRFHRHYYSVLNDHALADVQSADFMGHVPAEVNIFPFLFRRTTFGERPLFDQNTGESKRRLTDLYPFALQLGCDLTENRIVLPGSKAAGQG